MPSLEALVGLQLVVGVAGTVLDDEWKRHLAAIQPGGFISFARNCQSAYQLRALIAQVDEASARRQLVMIDHEGGRVGRFAAFGDGITRFGDALTIGRTKQPNDVRRQGEVEAAELKALGIHVNLAPCVDVLAEGCDPIIGDRSYGNNPERVSAMAVARIRGLQTGGVSACAKHFPGLGAVPKDPHKHLPTVGLDWTVMRTAHLVPFVEAIKTRVDTIMSSHVCYPKLDTAPDWPATFSLRLITDLLRHELGFEGLILTDDLEMGALGRLCPIGESAVRAVEAGHDVLLVCEGMNAQREVFEALGAAYRDGRLPKAELDRRAERIEAFRRRYFSSAS